jgi:hypothetical protein
MIISQIEALRIIEIFTKSSSFITKQILKLLATSADELEFPFPYVDFVMSPTTYRDQFLIYNKNDSSIEGERKMEKLVKRLIEEALQTD